MTDLLGRAIRSPDTTSARTFASNLSRQPASVARSDFAVLKPKKPMGSVLAWRSSFCWERRSSPPSARRSDAHSNSCQ